jgi:hypothetical protein
MKLIKLMKKQTEQLKKIDLSYMDITKKSITCPVCNEDKNSIVSSGISRGGIDLTYVICHKCTHIYMKYVPSNLAYTKFYESGDYRRLTGEHNDTKGIIEDPSKFSVKYSHGVRLYEQYLKGILAKGDVVFDFGCGDGAWLYGLRLISECDIDGNEPSLSDLEFIRTKMGVKIFEGLIEDCAEEIKKKYKGKVKLTIVSGSLQHMLDPMKCLSLAYEILSNDGYLYICNKNIFVHYISPKSPYPRKFAALRTVDHPHYFHEDSYRYMVEKSGFEIISFNNKSSVRAEHMEIFAKKILVGKNPNNLTGYNKILKKIRFQELKVSIYWSLPLRAYRWVKRKFLYNK